ncbi:PTHB1-like protein [Chloropicon primus]|uniref:PTHB1-like protein n=2 Tax=Chloropicon primus TaxID=1764295 RepID=A0A5B8MU62_9CHLO|nr:PTHB1-like protein [Chloropicon primus]UPR03318.1 PTHB1-like protein [Chloropicon primus]|eukprot:QDZ24109.1 PTHB1-like protein [Chloropicon primus]
MSLFRTKDWWRASVAGEEGEETECDGLAFCAANLDNDPSGSLKLAVGTLGGILRVYAPREPETTGADPQQGPSSHANSEDSIIEVQLEHPILQLEAGYFSPDYDTCLAVLHPRLLRVYALHKSGSAQDLQEVTLQKLYEHKLERSAANMCSGPFGRASTDLDTTECDAICVQSLDGQLSIFEQSSFAFSRFLGNFVVPGPLRYCKGLDMFFTVNSSYEVECYKYQTLTSATLSDNSKKDESSLKALGENNSFKHGKKLEANWRFVLGEGCVDIQCSRFTRGLKKAWTDDVIILGERTLFVLSSEGECKLQKRLEYPPTCLAVYPSKLGEQGAACNIMVATSTGYLMVYDSERLIWSARHDMVPVSVKVLTFGDLGGLVTTLDDKGALAVSYMGTDPPTQVVSIAGEEQLNFEEMESEHRQLLNVIRQHATQKPSEPVDILMLRAQIPQYMKALGEGEYGGSRGGYDLEDELGGRHSKAVVGKIFLNYSGISDITDVSISVDVPEPIVAEAEPSHISCIKGGSSGRQTPIVIQLKLFPGTHCLPSDRTLNVSASYQTPSGEPRISHCEVQLPLCLFGTLVSPVKNATYKLTLDTNKDAPQLVNVFEDIFASCQDNYFEMNSNVNVMSFKYFSGEIVTTIVSKNAGRYRIQSDCNGAMWLILQELKERLAAYYAAADQEGGEGLQISLSDNVPLEILFECIDKHFNSVEYVNKLHSDLELHGRRFRAVQKRFLVRFKDRRPEPLSHLEALLDDTYDNIIDCCVRIDETTADMMDRARDIVHNCHLFLSLLQCQFNLTEKQIHFLKKFLNPQVEHSQGGFIWEEYTEAALSYLLKAHLSKSQKDTISFGGVSKMTSTAKLKKLISTMVERFSRGITLRLPS